MGSIVKKSRKKTSEENKEIDTKEMRLRVKENVVSIQRLVFYLLCLKVHSLPLVGLSPPLELYFFTMTLFI